MISAADLSSSLNSDMTIHPSFLQHTAQYLGEEEAGAGLDAGGLAFARAGDVKDERHGMRGGEELSEPLAHLADGIRFAERNDEMRLQHVHAEVISL